MTERPILEAIFRRDPDNDPTIEPTDQDRKAFRNWVFVTYGREAWRDYHGVWDE